MKRNNMRGKELDEEACALDVQLVRHLMLIPSTLKPKITALASSSKHSRPRAKCLTYRTDIWGLPS